MRSLIVTVLFSVVAGVVAFAASTPGNGAPTTLISQLFATAYNRSTFASQVSATVNDVHILSPPSLVQLFTSKADGSNSFELIMPDETANNPVVWQVYEDIFSIYNPLGVATAGVPTMDTSPCPASYFGLCDYQIFSKNYAFFAYSSPAGLNVILKDPYFTIWNSGGGVAGTFGPPIAAPAIITSPLSSVAGTQQTFLSGIIFSYPNTSATPGVFGLSGPFYTLYNNLNGTSTLGFPTSAVVVINNATGLTQQTFEGGKIQQLPGADPYVLYPLGQVNILNAGQGLSLPLGSSATLTAITLDSQQNIVTGRALNWSTTNGAVANVVGNGYTAVVTGVGAGGASIIVSGEGKTSPPVYVTVGAGCCSIGQGAPAAVSAAFQAAATRNSLPASAIATGTVIRSGNGYVQTLDASGSAYSISLADGASTAYVISGSFYSAYLAAGGFSGALGYPVSDLLPGNAQKFAGGGALAGIPPLLIPSGIAPKWFQNQSAAGSPSSLASSFSSYSGTSGIAQVFSGGAIYAVTSGSLGGQAFFSYGAILARYNALSGAAGALGAPVGDVVSAGGVLTESFEGGSISLQPGASVAVEHYNPRTPAISVVPSAVAPGGRVHVSATGFAPGSTLAFTQTGQTGFSVSVPAGAFSWDLIVPAASKASVVSIAANDTGSKDAASASYTIAPPAALLPQLKILSGDLQTGYPASQLPLPITAVLTDSAGNPIPNSPVTLSTSPGASAGGPAATDSNGRVTVALRLPAQIGLVTGSIAAAGQVITFSALATSGSLTAFPSLIATGQQNTLLASLASAMLFGQNTGTLSSAGGVSGIASLSSYLSAQNGFAVADTGDSIPNPWVAARFSSGALLIPAAGQNQIRDLIASGVPAIVNLNLTVDGKAGGGASVVGTGVASDGSILIFDPNPATAQTSLNSYLSGFTAQGHIYSGSIASVLGIASSTTSAVSPFTAAAPLTGNSSIASSGAACAQLDLAGAIAPGGVRYQYCDGSASLYELDFALRTGASLVDLSGGASVTIPANNGARWTVSRKNGVLTAVPATLTISAVIDSAAYSPSLAPNQLFSVFGTGFSSQGLSVTLDGRPVQIGSVSPFQINALIPAATAPSAGIPLTLNSAGSTATATVSVVATAPAIFAEGSVGAILNPDATLNSPSNPVPRGQYVSVYCSGLGATVSSGGLQVASTGVSVLLAGQTLKPLYAGTVAGFVGLYQVNVAIPATTPPGLAVALQLSQGKTSSNTVPLSID